MARKTLTITILLLLALGGLALAENARFFVGLGSGGQGWYEEKEYDPVANQVINKSWRQTVWVEYREGSNGETRVAHGDIDADGKDEIILGFGPTPERADVPSCRFEVYDDNFAFLGRYFIGPPGGTTYCSDDGQLWPAVGDADHDGIDEIILGYGPNPYWNGAGYFAIVDWSGFPPSPWLKKWGQIQWDYYVRNQGETRPVVGDIDGDGQDEIVVGLGPFPEDGGWVEIFEYIVQPPNDLIVHKDWVRVYWPGYNAANGETRPACGDIDGDSPDEILLGLGPAPELEGGSLEIKDDSIRGYASKGWVQVYWGGYRNTGGGTRPGCLDIDGIYWDEMIVGLDAYSGDPAIPGGWFELKETDPNPPGANFGSTVTWGRVSWEDYNNLNGETSPNSRGHRH